MEGTWPHKNRINSSCFVTNKTRKSQAFWLLHSAEQPQQDHNQRQCYCPETFWIAQYSPITSLIRMPPPVAMHFPSGRFEASYICLKSSGALCCKRIEVSTQIHPTFSYHLHFDLQVPPGLNSSNLLVDFSNQDSFQRFQKECSTLRCFQGIDQNQCI